MKNWMSIEVELPQINKEVLVWSKDIGRCVGRRDCDFKKNFVDGNDCFIFNVTHWMELPESPYESTK